jgi:hypothetical protein
MKMHASALRAVAGRLGTHSGIGLAKATYRSTASRYILWDRKAIGLEWNIRRKTLGGDVVPYVRQSE